MFLSDGGPVRVAEARTIQTVDRDATAVGRSRLCGTMLSPGCREPHGAAADERVHYAPVVPRANDLLGRVDWVAGLGKDGRAMVTAPPPARPDPRRGRSRPPALTVLQEDS